MRNIPPPASDLATDNRFMACSEALEPALSQVIDRACLAGWSRTEAILVTSALLMRFAAEMPGSGPGAKAQALFG